MQKTVVKFEHCKLVLVKVESSVTRTI